MYQNYAIEKLKARSTTVLNKWACAMMYIILLIQVFQTLALEVFVIPSASMEGTLIEGDRVICSKLHYGARLANLSSVTPVFYRTTDGMFHNLIDNCFRLPGFSSIKRGDLLLFNFPPEMDKPIPQKSYFIKRCVALPGDRFAMIKNKLYINGEETEFTNKIQFSYFIKTQVWFEESFFENLGIYSFSRHRHGYNIFATPKQAEILAKMPVIYEVSIKTQAEGERNGWVFPYAEKANWNRDNFGSLLVPQAGMTIPITLENMGLYGNIIKHCEDLREVSIQHDRLYIGGRRVWQYTFKQNYYFTLGDNRHNSHDSRFWGFLPEDHIVGKPVMIYFSIDNKGKMPALRGQRMFKLID